MPTGRLFEVVDRPLERWTFLNPDSLLHLASFSNEDSARSYAAMNGYELADPPRIKGKAIDDAQPALEAPPTIVSNSPLPNLRAVATASAPKPKPPSGPPIRMGMNLGARA